MGQQPSYWKVLTRRKQLSQESTDGESKLNRVLGLYDLTALGVGSTLGAGVYVLAGQIAKDQAGPSVMISFAIAALASLLAGVCYAEFGARVPKAGSAYVYSYVCIGEFAAFVIGWNLILEYMIGTASVCRGISLYLDTIINDTLKTTFAEIAPMNVSFLGSYFDFFACGLVAVFGVALAFGVETSVIANNFCTCLNLSILSFVIIAGSLKANFSNWTIDVDAVNATNISPDTDLGVGGFFPFGFTGTLKGAATCFFGFVGFDCIATTGEEVQNPRKNIPRSILLSLLVIFLCYFGVSTVITLMVPYYLQDANAPLPSAFKEVGWNFAMWIVSIGGLVGLLASLFGALFPLPRVMYSMAQDNLMFRVFARIHPKYRVPVMGSIVAAMLTALIAGLFDLAQLVNLLSIGTLLAYSVVAISITILRYMDNADTFGKSKSNGNIDPVIEENGNCNGIDNANNSHHHHANGNGHSFSERSLLTSKGERITFKSVVMQLFNIKRQYTPNELSTRIVGALIIVFCIVSAGIGLIFMQAYDALISNKIWVLILLIVLCVLIVFVLLCICLQPRELCIQVFTVPLVPLVPAISIFINIYLMLQLDVMTWIRFGVWMAIGIPMFVACWCMYDIKNPARRHPDRLRFERFLKLSCRTPPKTTESFTQNVENDLNTSTSTLVMQQNERTVRSLDDIMDLREIEGDLKIVKHPNGQVCFVEDSKQNNSETIQKKLEDNDKSNYTSEEEKNVIALLDNVLEAEDETQRESNLQICDRKASVDSEMVPCVIRSTTIVTVHSSSNSESSENFHRHSNNSKYSATTAFEETQKAALKLVEDILNSQEVWLALERQLEKPANQQNLNVIEINNNHCANVGIDFKPIEIIHNHGHVILSSVESGNPQNALNSVPSVEPINDPLRSEHFRNKLSRLIVKPLKINSPKEAAKTGVPIQKYCSELNHSKNEVDNKATATCYIMTEAKISSENSIKKDELNIPKPPKFDPELYHTLNGLRGPKRRISLDKILRKTELVVSLDETAVSPDTKDTLNNELPFKQRLEAILIRGPSRCKISQNPKFTTPIQIQNEPIAGSQNYKTQINLNKTSFVLKEARRQLRPPQDVSNEL